MPDALQYGGRTTAVDFPPLVYVPVTELPEEPGVQRLQMHTLDDGRTAIFAYSALDRMAELYGDRPWTVVDVATLERAHADAPYDVLSLDRELVRAERAPTDAADGATRGIFRAGAGPTVGSHSHEEASR